MQGLDSLMDKLGSKNNTPAASPSQTPGQSSSTPPPASGTDKIQDIMKGLFGR